jgi:peroxiredoxin family protein
MSDSLSLVLFSGTTDKLHAAATVAAGAPRAGQSAAPSWALDAFRADHIDADHGLAFESTAPGSSQPVRGTAAIPWLETFRMAKELGEVTIQACSGSLETLGVDAGRLDPLVDGPCGIASFLMAAEGGQILFI